MKTIKFIIVFVLLIYNNTIYAQPIPPGHGLGHNVTAKGGGASLDKGIVFLFVFSALYLGLKYFFIFNKYIKKKA